MSSDAPKSLHASDPDLNLSLDTTASTSSPHATRRSDSHIVRTLPRDMEQHEREEDIGQGPSTSALGQFSFAPTTRTTVVTTTTTTTTAFPPLIFRPPLATKDLDTRLYPLAASPTPAALRNLKFNIGDQSIIFNEPEDTAGTACQVCSIPSFPRTYFSSAPPLCSHDSSYENRTKHYSPPTVSFVQSTPSAPRIMKLLDV